MADTIRVAHLSDLHLLSLDGVRWLDFANKRCTGGLNLISNRARHYHAHIFEAMVRDINAQGVDQIICTGDVTNLALEPEFLFARELFAGFALDPAHITVVPGNHDVYVPAGRALFSKFFADYMSPDRAWQREPSDGRDQAGNASTDLPEVEWPIVRVRGQVAIIGISTSIPTPWFTAYGKIDRRQLARLRDIMTSPALEGKLRLIAIHHPPAGRAAKNLVRGLHGWARLAETLAATGAELVIHGHEHRDLRHSLPGPDERGIPVLGIQSGSYCGERPERTARYRIFHVGPNKLDRNGRSRLLAQRMRMWDPDSEGFVEDVASGAIPLPSKLPA